MSPIDPYFLESHGEEGGDDRGEQVHCPECDYDLRGTPLNRPCPECGWMALLDEAAAVTRWVQGNREGATHDRDPSTTCPSCGYDLHGLTAGALCPECGTKRPGAGGPAPRILRLPELPAAVRGSLRWRCATGLLAVTSAAFLLACLVRTFGLRDNTWHTVLLTAGVLIAVSCWAATSSATDGRASRFMQPLRWAMRLLVLCLPASVLVDTPAVAAGVSLLGLIGLAMFLWYMAMMARVGDLMRTSRRFELAWILCMPLGGLSWLLPVPGVPVNFPRNEFGYVFGFFALCMFLPLAVLTWYVFRPSLTMCLDSAWVSRERLDEAHKEARRAHVGTCVHCGHSLEGIMSHAPCPGCRQEQS